MQHQVGSGRVNARTFGQDLCQRPETPVFFLVNLRGTRDEVPEHVAGERVRMDAQRGECLREFRGMDGSRPDRPRLVERGDRRLVVVADHAAPDRLGRMARPPPADMTGQAALVEDVPDRLAGPRM